MKQEYIGREQTLAKHFILEKYLQGVAFKVLQGGWPSLSYVDGFSGPWHSETDDGSDTSFMIAIKVLKDAQAEIERRTGTKKTVRCFFCEKDPIAYASLEKLVDQFHDPDSQFYVYTYQGEFEKAVPLILNAWGNQSFRLVFIDPTGWTGYPLEIVGPLLKSRGTEVLVNFMYDYINRFNGSNDPKIIEQFDQILGGTGWQGRLDPQLSRGEAVKVLFKNALRSAGQFAHVASARIEKSTTDRPHFDLIYGTKSFDGLAHFRVVEATALKAHYDHRQKAKVRKADAPAIALGQEGLFTNEKLSAPDQTYERNAKASLEAARSTALIKLEQSGGQILFEELAATMMEQFSIRLTTVKDLCLSLEQSGHISNTWTERRKRKPDKGIVICRKA